MFRFRVLFLVYKVFYSFCAFVYWQCYGLGTPALLLQRLRLNIFIAPEVKKNHYTLTTTVINFIYRCGPSALIT